MVRPSPVSPDDEKSRKGHGNAFLLPSPRGFHGQEGELGSQGKGGEDVWMQTPFLSSWTQVLLL